jgi:hypothetical protein
LALRRRDKCPASSSLVTGCETGAHQARCRRGWSREPTHTLHRMAPQKLKNLIHAIRACKTAADEREVVNKECAVVRCLRSLGRDWRDCAMRYSGSCRKPLGRFVIALGAKIPNIDVAMSPSSCTSTCWATQLTLVSWSVLSLLRRANFTTSVLVSGSWSERPCVCLDLLYLACL